MEVPNRSPGPQEMLFPGKSFEYHNFVPVFSGNPPGFCGPVLPWELTRYHQIFDPGEAGIKFLLYFIEVKHGNIMLLPKLSCKLLQESGYNNSAPIQD